MSHPTWQLDLETGALVLTPCPGTKGVELQASLEQLKAQGVEAIWFSLNDGAMSGVFQRYHHGIAVADLNRLDNTLKCFYLSFE